MFRKGECTRYYCARRGGGGGGKVKEGVKVDVGRKGGYRWGVFLDHVLGLVCVMGICWVTLSLF